eukprot:GILJ01006208.1.p1 GENE.GILJ01006208.1~~GILJ01006208.1.p1  ORF type:complete len:588 (+),score=109.02 GILJ01006208.1:103-1764(+)
MANGALTPTLQAPSPAVSRRGSDAGPSGFLSPHPNDRPSSTQGAPSPMSRKNANDDMKFKSAALKIEISLAEALAECSAFAQDGTEGALDARKAEAVCKVIEMIAQQNTPFQQAMQFVASEVRACIFCDEIKVPQFIKTQLALLDPKRLAFVPYFDLASESTSLYENDKKQWGKTQAHLQFLIDDLKSELTTKNAQIEDMEKRLKEFERDKETGDTALKKEKRMVAHLKEHNTKLKSQMESLQTDNGILIAEIERFKDREEKWKEEFERVSEERDGLEKERMSLLQVVEGLQMRLSDMTDSYQNILSHYRLAQNVRERTQNQVNRVETENVKLKGRAAVNFEELTPRPNWKQVGESIQPLTLPQEQTTLLGVKALTEEVSRLYGELAASLQEKEGLREDLSKCKIEKDYVNQQLMQLSGMNRRNSDARRQSTHLSGKLHSDMQTPGASPRSPAVMSDPASPKVFSPSASAKKSNSLSLDHSGSPGLTNREGGSMAASSPTNAKQHGLSSSASLPHLAKLNGSSLNQRRGTELSSLAVPIIGRFKSVHGPGDSI